MTSGAPDEGAAAGPAAAEPAPAGRRVGCVLLPAASPSAAMLERMVRIAGQAGADPIIAVVPPGVAVPAPARAAPAPRPGRAGSDASAALRTGLMQLTNAPVRAALLWPADLPFASLGSVLAILDGFERAGAPVVAPAFGGRLGEPMLFARDVWLELMTAPDGPRGVADAHRTRALVVAVDDDGVLRGAGTPPITRVEGN